ncbi:hypothetical protein N7462_006283 [Penicillium macrosclerotiorum]|uniref:uncharacterized protein n=1 Tax=Penicillium macrosclerotiorum TaxID=303699 RepID=UPI00254714F4|nr:uncharacterized protein N7462_006283 [Penicillium macrosclerotiorum]KAJ5683118.1 hypothetical protein N7462_006283 [Penicillium macrosclerotiorum]
MIPSIILLSTLVASALGGNSSTYNFPSGFNIGLVKPDQLNSWCEGQRNVCPSICKGSTKQNTCDPNTLKFDCICSDGTTPDVSPFIQTVPFYVCEATYGQCIDSHPNDAQGQRACKQAATCGKKNSTASDTTSSSASASSTMAIATATGSDSSKTTSSAVAAASTTTNAAIILGSLEGYSTGLMAGAMVLAMRFFL